MVHTYTQSMDNIKLRKQGVAFRDWQRSLNRKDKLPRGRWFAGKKAGKQVLLQDEAWLILK